jgi:hypothetical protein
MRCILSPAILAKKKLRLSSSPVWPLHLRLMGTERILRMTICAVLSAPCPLSGGD